MTVDRANEHAFVRQSEAVANRETVLNRGTVSNRGTVPDRQAAQPGATGLAALAYAACGTVTWMAALNLAWFAGTLLGGVVLGAGPSTAAAYTLTRRRMRGEGIRFVRDFWAEYRGQWRSGNLVFAPVVVVAGSLAFSWSYAVDSHAAWPFIALLVVVTTVVIGAAGVLAPMYAHYDLPWQRYVVTALRFSLAMPWAMVLLIALAAAVVLVTAMVPALFWFVSVGAWIYLDTALCFTLFAANDSRLEQAADDSRLERHET
jgi:uncharacterized membrane protein YesL